MDGGHACAQCTVQAACTAPAGGNAVAINWASPYLNGSPFDNERNLICGIQLRHCSLLTLNNYHRQ